MGLDTKTIFFKIFEIFEKSCILIYFKKFSKCWKYLFSAFFEFKKAKFKTYSKKQYNLKK